MDIEKAFDSLDHDFGSNFLSWIKLLLNSQQSCVNIGDNTTPYFNLKKGAHQADPVSVYLFILALEVLFILLKVMETNV